MSRYSQFRHQSEHLRSGARDRPVLIEERQSGDTVDGAGFPSDNSAGWTTLSALEWMHKRDLGGQERLTAQQLSSPIDTVWTMSYRADMDPDLVDVPKLRRLVYQGRTYDIVAASQIGLREGVELMTLAAPR
jgi:hypothetical protein